MNEISIRGFTSVLNIVDAKTRKLWIFCTPSKTPSLDVVKFLSFNILSALVLICSSCIATTNASTSLKRVHMSSSHSSLNNASFVSKTHHLVHHDTQVSKETAHLFSNVYKKDLVEHSAKLSRSRKPRGKNELCF